MLSRWSDDELRHEVMAVPRGALVPLPDTQIIRLPGLTQIITPSFRRGGMNDISFTNLDEAEADAIIDEALARYHRAGVRFRWIVGPDSRPADLADRLARRGLRAVDTLGMIRETTELPETDAGVGVAVEEVDESTVDVSSETMATGWNVDTEPMRLFHRIALARPERSYRLYIARHQGTPAGAAGLVAFDRSVYLIGAVVLPEHRGRGLYRALVDARLRHAASCGIPLATCQAMPETSAPILERLGFTTVCRFPTFVND